MVTRGASRVGRTIRKLQKSVEFSAKESEAKELETKHKLLAQEGRDYNEDSPIQDLCGFQVREKTTKQP